MAKIKFVKVNLNTDKTLSARDAEKIRGYIGRKFSEDVNFHNHGSKGYIYRYPLVQYKVVDRQPMIVGLACGVDSVWRLFQDIDSLNLERKNYRLFEKSIIGAEVDFGLSQKRYTYKFKTPWYSLNQKNFLTYNEIKDLADKRAFLSKILIGNILSMSKSLGLSIDKPIKVTDLLVNVHTFCLDNIKILGFLGTFSVNFNIPDYLGLGKSVSRGFGTVVKIKTAACKDANAKINANGKVKA